MAQRHTTAYFAVTKNLERARALSLIFDSGSLKPKPGDRRSGGRPSGEERELLRAAVIFSIGALDAYLSDVAAEVLVRQLEKARVPGTDARNLLRRIQSDIPTLPFELALTSDQDERLRLAQTAISEHLATAVSNHGAKGVAGTLGRIGATVDWEAIKLSDKSTLRTTSTRTCAAVLDRWTDMRHQLVHQGKAIPVNAEQARELIDFVQAIVEHVDRQALAALS
jgi:RiboL-PSP-HEPN